MADKIYTPAPSLFSKFTDLNGKPLSRGYLYSYKAGTSELKTTYKDSYSQTVNTNPIRLDDEGFCTLFISTSQSDTYDDAYRFELYDENKVFIRSVENVVSIKGKDGEPYKVILIRGERGETGSDGKSIPGPVRTGPQGATSDSGDFIKFWNKTGIYSFTIPDKCYSIKYKLQGAGGGFLLPKTLPDTGIVYTGRAGQYLYGELPVNPGDIININVGKGGEATTNQLIAAGGNTSISSDNFPTVTAAGGSSGSNDGNGTASMYRKLMPAIYFYNVDGTYIPSIPRAVPGESSLVGQAGDVYSQNGGVGGNGASGGTGIPSIDTNGNIIISSYYAGGDGYVEIVYNTGVN